LDTTKYHALDSLVKRRDGTKKYKTRYIGDLPKDHYLLTTTYFTKIYIEYNGEQLLVDLNSFSYAGKYGDQMNINITDPTTGIYSYIHKRNHKKTKHTKCMVIKCNMGKYGSHAILKLESDISIDDMSSVSLHINGLDIKHSCGGFVSEDKLIRLNSLTQTKLTTCQFCYNSL
jgi:hypothetical protein